RTFHVTGVQTVLFRSHAFAALNGALATNDMVLRVASGARIETPIHVVHYGAAADAAIAWQLRTIVELGEGARVRLIEHHVGEQRSAERRVGEADGYRE